MNPAVIQLKWNLCFDEVFFPLTLEALIIICQLKWKLCFDQVFFLLTLETDCLTGEVEALF